MWGLVAQWLERRYETSYISVCPRRLLVGSQSFRELDFRDNDIGEAGAKEFIAALDKRALGEDGMGRAVNRTAFGRTALLFYQMFRIHLNHEICRNFVRTQKKIAPNVCAKSAYGARA